MCWSFLSLSATLPGNMEVIMIRSEMLAITGCILLACVSPSFAQEDTIQEDSTDRIFPREVTLHHGETDYQLEATGATVRKKFIAKVYAIVHYMDVATFAGEDEALEAARSGEHASQITMEFARGVGAEKIRNAFRDGFKKNSSESDFSELQPLIALFVAYFDEKIEKNDQIVLQRFPDGTIVTIVAGEEMDPIRGMTFASALWDIWLGEHSIVDRKKLVKLTYEE